jgi:hypothetical protein
MECFPIFGMGKHGIAALVKMPLSLISAKAMQ